MPIFTLVKFTALILLFGMFGMAIQPPMSGMKQKGCHMTSMVKSCCAAKHQGQDKQHKKSSKDCCSDGTCSFACCACCMAYYAPSSSFEFTPYHIVSKELNATVPQFLPLDIVRNTFHPPQLV